MIRSLFQFIALPIGISVSASAFSQNARTSDQDTSLLNALRNIEITGTTDAKLKECDAMLVTIDKDGKGRSECIKLSPKDKLEQNALFAAIFSESYNCAKAAGQLQNIDQALKIKTEPETETIITKLQNRALNDVVGNSAGKEPEDAAFVRDYMKKLLDGNNVHFKQSLPSDPTGKKLLEAFRDTAYTAVNYCSKVILGYDFHDRFNDPQAPKVEITGAKKSDHTARPEALKQEQ